MKVKAQDKVNVELTESEAESLHEWLSYSEPTKDIDAWEAEDRAILLARRAFLRDRLGYILTGEST